MTSCTQRMHYGMQNDDGIIHHKNTRSAQAYLTTFFNFLQKSILLSLLLGTNLLGALLISLRSLTALLPLL